MISIFAPIGGIDPSFQTMKLKVPPIDTPGQIRLHMEADGRVWSRFAYFNGFAVREREDLECCGPLWSQIGGGRGIRTPGTLSGTTVFKTAGINRSPIPPQASRWTLLIISVLDT